MNNLNVLEFVLVVTVGIVFVVAGVDIGSQMYSERTPKEQVQMEKAKKKTEYVLGTVQAPRSKHIELGLILIQPPSVPKYGRGTHRRIEP